MLVESGSRVLKLVEDCKENCPAVLVLSVPVPGTSEKPPAVPGRGTEPV